MKKLFILMLAVTSAVSVFGQRGAWSNDDTPTPSNIHDYKTKGMKGSRLDATWATLEASPGIYSFSSTKTYIHRLADSGMYVRHEINFGPDAPLAWLHDSYGVDTFSTHGGGLNGPYPNYYDTNYIKRYLVFIDTLSKFYNAQLNSNDRKYFLRYFAKNATTGDYFGYKGTPNTTAYGIAEDSVWLAYTLKMFDSVRAIFTRNCPWLGLAFNPSNDFKCLRTYQTRYPGCWLKYGDPTHGYPIAGEAFITDSLKAIDTTVIFAEIQQPMSNTIYGRKDWLALLQSDLTMNGQVADFSGSMFADDSSAALIAYFNKYADQQNATTAKRGFIQLADKVSVDSIARWTEGTYGALITNTSGYNAAINPINASTAPALQKKILVLNKTIAFTNATRLTNLRAGSIAGALYNADTPYLNDYVYSGVDNYGLGVKQKVPNSTSFGVYRYGPANAIYGRNGRKFMLDGSGRGNMYFDIDDAYRRTPTNDSVRIEVVYLDEGTGRWGLYCFRCRAFKFGQITNTNSGLFKTAVFVVPNFRWGNRLANGSDINLRLLDGDNFTVSTIAVERLN